MNEGLKSRLKEIKKHWRLVIWGFLTLCSFFGLLLNGDALISGPFPKGSGLYVSYFTYSICVIVFIHAMLFLCNGLSKHHNGRSLSKHLPKYLEYAYATVLLVSLAQVFFLSSHFSDYIAFTSGNNYEIVNRIRKQAAVHLLDDCPKGGLFTSEYCAKMRKILESKELEQYILDSVINDSSFLNQTIGEEVRAVAPAGALVVPITSPISRDIDRLRARHEYSVFYQSTVASRAFTWIAAMLLPLGIGLRVVKTSLDLFGDLE